MDSPIKILIADDHSILREGLRRYLEQYSEFEVIGEACSGTDTLQKCERLKPDVVILDISMPAMNGIDCAKILKEKNPETRVLTLTCLEDEENLKECLLAGVNAYVLKRSFSEDLRLAILTVSRGGTFIDAAIGSKFLTLLKDENQIKLSDRELQVIKLIAKGLSLKDVGQELNISVKTVETYKLRCLEKLSLKSRADLIKYDIDHGLLGRES